MNALEVIECWRRFERGDGLNLKQVRAMIKQIDEAMPYLQARADQHGRLVVTEAHLAREKLASFKQQLVSKKPLRGRSA